MKNFFEWLKEAYGFETEEVENIDEELYGIRETLKNALAGGNLAYNWGDLEMRIRSLQEKGVDRNKLQQAVRTYQAEVVSPITRAYNELNGRGKATLDDPINGKIVRQAIQDAQAGFKNFQDDLNTMGSRSSQY